jgi:hypothetical protein
MMRSALEQLLLDQGYKQRMVGPKLGQLQKDLDAGRAPKWATELDPEFLGVIKQLGDGATHADEGDVTGHSALDAELLAKLKATFQMLLLLVYEDPRKKAALLADLKGAAGALKPPKDTS